MSFIERVTESVPPAATHAIAGGSLVVGTVTSSLAQYAETASHLTKILGLVVVFVTLMGGVFYAGYWAAKGYAKWRRVLRGDYSDS